MIYPTQRAVALTLGAAPVALAIGVVTPQGWTAAIGWVALIAALVAVDAVLARPLGRRTLTIGAPATAQVGETIDLAPRLERHGAAIGAEFAADLSEPFEPVRAAGTGQLSFRATRRGTGKVRRVWARRAGPLGLAWRQIDRAANARVLVLPDLRPVREQGMRQFLRSTLFGARMRLESGDGSEFQALTDFQPGMERRTIDWKSSARHRSLLAREYRTERDNSVVFAIDAGRGMSDPVDGVPRVDRAVSAALLAAFMALKSGDRVRLYGFAARPLEDSGTLTGARSFARLHATAAALDYGSDESNYTLSLITLDQRLEGRSLIVLFTEFTDPTAAELMIAAAARMLKRHRVLFVLFADQALEDITADRPADGDAVVRATVAATLLRERRIVIERLKRLGIDVLEARADDLALALADRYLAIRRRL